MREHDATTPMADEPEDGWASGPTLADSEILTVVLCRYTGQMPVAAGRYKGACDARVINQHPDEDCLTLYHQADALRSGRVHYDMPAREVTITAGGDEPTYQHPV